MAVTEHVVRAGGVELNVATAGNGAPVLLLHGFPDSWQVWRFQIAALAAAGYRVIGPDRYVVTDPPPGPRVSCPTMGIWSTGDRFLCETQMLGSEKYVDGPWRYERVDADHWLPTSAPNEVNRLLLDFLR
jgi:pimeloyl-ACP methyl ester carboxylesterase